jgi:O-antigen/teichoic acid export membrane protein
VAIPMTFLSDWVVTLLFGNAYQQAGAVLSIHVWTGVFVFLGVSSGQWFLIENLQKLAFYRTLLAAVINIAANLLLIPKYGAIGAAVGTVLSQMTAAYVFDIMSVKTRSLFWMKTRALYSPLLFNKTWGRP